MNVPGINDLNGNFFFDSPVDSSYGFIIEKTKMRNQKLRKVETVMHTGTCPNNQSLNLSVVYQPIDDHTIHDIARIPNTSICTYNINAIQLVHNNFARNLPINQTTPLIRKTFTVEGIDINGPNPTINDGLLGMRISSGSDGIRTIYTFGTTKMIAPAKPDVSRTRQRKARRETATIVKELATVLVDDIVLDIDSAEGLPKDDSIGAVVGKDVVVDFKVGDGGVAGDLKAIAGVAANDVIDNDLVFAAEVQTVVESAASAAVIVNVIGAVDVAAGAFLRINAIQTLGAGVGWISVVVDVAIEDLVTARLAYARASVGGIGARVEL